MIGFTWAKDQADEMWHVPVMWENATTTYLCYKGRPAGMWTEMSDSVYHSSQLPGKICERCLLEEIVLGVAK